MLGTTNFLSRHTLNFLFSLITSAVVIILFGFGEGLVLILSAIVTYYVSNKSITMIQKSKKRKALDLSRSEYKHIEEQIKQARTNINSLTQQYVKVRSIKSFKLINEMTKLSKRILAIVHQNPTKFYAVEDFFYSHLPSAVQLTDTYTMLTQQQLKDAEINLALEDTRKTLKELHVTMENDLRLALESDLENLKIELDYVKLENEKNRQQIEFRGDK